MDIIHKRLRLFSVNRIVRHNIEQTCPCVHLGSGLSVHCEISAPTTEQYSFVACFRSFHVQAFIWFLIPGRKHHNTSEVSAYFLTTR